MSERKWKAGAGKPQWMGKDGAGIMLEDVFKLLSLAPREKLLSLTFKLGHSQVEELVHAMSLIGLGRGPEALRKLQALGDNRVARCLAEMIKRHGSWSEAILRDRGIKPEAGADMAIELARIFQVLAEEKFCDESQRNQAYRAALWACSHQIGNEGGQITLERLVQEAREVCGSEFGALSKGAISCHNRGTQSSISGLHSYSPHGSSDPGEATTSMRIQGSRGSNSSRTDVSSDPSRTEDGSSPPSSLRTFPSSWSSYPSHLEVSMSATVQFDVCKANSDVQDPRSLSPRTTLSEELQEATLTCGAHISPGHNVSPGLSPVQSETEGHSVQSCPLGENLSANVSLPVAPSRCISQPQQGPAGISHVTQHDENPGNHQILTPKDTKVKTAPEHRSSSERPCRTSEPSVSTSASLSSGCKSQTVRKHLNQEDQEEEEEFFSFVILHSPEDMELAMRLQEKLEALVVGPGATFTQDFAVPGKNRLSCVDSAINNSAFTILLLSRNFNSQMLEYESNCALMSSLENRHKSNTVIPLLPRENCLPRESIPSCLRIFVPLEEGARGFEKKATRAMAPSRIERQKSVWRQERRIRVQQERELRMREDNKRSAALLRQTELMQDEVRLRHMLLEQQKMLEHYQSLLNVQPGQAPAPGMSIPPQGLGAYCTPFPHSSIHIENASCIMIGNDSQMTVGKCGGKVQGERGEEGSDRELLE